jgi:hypothetical protein
VGQDEGRAGGRCRQGCEGRAGRRAALSADPHSAPHTLQPQTLNQRLRHSAQLGPPAQLTASRLFFCTASR